MQSQQAVNVIPAVRVFQNNRNSEARGSILPVDVGATTTIATTGGGFGGGGTTPLGLTDLLADPARGQLYIANPGLNRIEVFNTKTQQFGTPIPVGQLPRSMAFGTDNNTLYVANSGSELVSIVDLTKGAVVGAATLPALPFSTTTTAPATVYPWVIASSQHGPRVLMTDGTLWKIVGNSLLPSTASTAAVGNITSIGTAATAQQAQMVSTTDGAYTLILSGTGMAYLYSAVNDSIINARSALANTTGTISSYYGAVAAGPGGEYYLVNDQVLNQALTIVSSPTSTTTTGPSQPIQIGPITIGGLPPISNVTLTARPVAAVAAATAQNYLRFSTPLRASSTAVPTDAGLVELVDVSTQRAMASMYTLEGPLTQVVGSTRVNVAGRTMALDSATATVYALTASGLSVVPLAATNAAPTLSSSPIVNSANYQNKMAPGGLVSIFGQNLGTNGVSGAPLPAILGGTCVTLGNTPLPLLLTSPTQINAQLPPTVAAGTYPLVVRSVSNQAASNSANAVVSKYAPAVFVDAQGPAIFHQDGTRVDKNHPATRDEPLAIYATGLGVTTGGKVTAGNLSPSSPLAVTATVQVFFGDPTISDAGVIVDWSGLAPGNIGLYLIKCRIPGTHLRGDALKVTLRIGGVSSPVTGANVPVVYVN